MRPGAANPVERVSARAAAGGRPPRTITVRAIIFAVVVVLAFALVVPTLGQYVAAERANAQLRSQISAAKGENEDLQAQLDRWKDPAFVAAQARERLSFVYPGETPYRVVEPDGAVHDAAGGAAKHQSDTSDAPWYSTMWSSIAGAGASATGHEDATGGGK